MNIPLALLITVYALAGVSVAVAVWKHEFSDHGGDSVLAGLGALLSVLMGAFWPFVAAVVPVGLAVHGIGKLIVRHSE